ncbi:hypothetical protein D3C80_1106500 [compost metagenome]
MATITRSGRSRSTSARSTRVLRTTRTPASSISRCRLVLAPPNSARRGSSCASNTWPPNWALASYKVTSCPRRAATAAAFMPAGPPPAIMMRLRAAVGCNWPYCSSRPVSGCWMQEIGKPLWKWPMQAWLQAMQARTSSTWPPSVLFGICGSQIRARVMPQTSAWPRAMISSASWGWLMRPVTNTGTARPALKVLASLARYAASTAIGGTI